MKSNCSLDRVVVVTLQPFAYFAGGSLPLVFLVALLVTLIPTTIGGLLSAIGIAGMDRLVRLNVIAKSGYVLELPVKGLLATSGVVAIVVGLALHPMPAMIPAAGTSSPYTP